MENLFIFLYYATMSILALGIIFTILYFIDPEFRDAFHEDWRN